MISALRLRSSFKHLQSFHRKMRIEIIPLNSDNYGYLVINEKTNNCMVVDVSNQPEIILSTVKQHNVNLTTVLTTHHHWDHAGGNNTIKDAVPNVEIIGGKIDNVEGCTRFVEDGEQWTYEDDINVRCIHTPGHTNGHISYFIEQGNHRTVFTGDCLFIGGCGKFFEGTGADMYQALYEKLGSLPPDTLIYCGHEYTLSNYKFALSCEPNNTHLIEANEKVKKLREAGKPSIPSTIEHERLTNPFLRVMFPTVRALFPDLQDDISVLSAVREAKNNFK